MTALLIDWLTAKSSDPFVAAMTVGGALVAYLWWASGGRYERARVVPVPASTSEPAVSESPAAAVPPTAARVAGDAPHVESRVCGCGICCAHRSLIARGFAYSNGRFVGVN
jgi:hypothetical protein